MYAQSITKAFILTMKHQYHESNVLYSRKIWRFGSWPSNRQIKIHQNSFHAYMRMAILYRTAKFNSRQYVSNGD